MERLFSLLSLPVLILVVALIYLSFGSISLLATGAVQAILLAVLIFLALRELFSRRQSNPHAITLMRFFLVWLIIQAAGQYLKWPLFLMPASWENNWNLFLLFLCGLSAMAWMERAILSRAHASILLNGWILIAAVMAIAFVVLAYRSGLNVERLKLPQVFLDWTGPWAGVSIQPNNLVDLWFPAAFYAVAFVFYFGKRRELAEEVAEKGSSIIFQALYGVVSLVLIAGILATKSRGGILSFAAAAFGFCVFFVLSHKRKDVALAQLSGYAAALLLLLFLFGAKEVISELQTVSKTMESEIQLKGVRALTIGASLQLALAKGWLGVGLGQFQNGWLFFHRPPFDYGPERSYNDFLWMWAETGIPGILFFMGVLGISVIRSVMVALKSESYFIRYLSLAVFATTVSFCFHALMDPTFYAAPLLWLFALNIGVGLALESMEQEENAARRIAAALNERSKPVWRRTAGAFLFAAIAVSGFWYNGNKIAGAMLVNDSTADDSRYQKALKLDPLNADYPVKLASMYEEKYRSTGTEEYFFAAVRMLEKAISLSPFRVPLYVRRAQLFRVAENNDGIRESFQLMRERLPDYYRGELAAAGFYMSQAEEAGNAADAALFKKLAIDHLETARKLYPDFNLYLELYPFSSPSAIKAFKAHFTETAARN